MNYQDTYQDAFLLSLILPTAVQGISGGGGGKIRDFKGLRGQPNVFFKNFKWGKMRGFKIKRG